MEEGSTKERKLALFWDERIKICSYWVIFINSVQFLSSAQSTINPKTEELKLIAPLYLICAVACYILLFLDFKKKCNTAYGVLIFVIFRSCMRLFDLENKRSLDEETDWFFKVVFQTMGSFTHITIFFVCSPATRFHTILT